MYDFSDRNWRATVLGVVVPCLIVLLCISAIVGIAVLFDIIAEVVR